MDKETKQSAIQLAYAGSIGIAMAAAIFGCFFLGIWLDRKLGTQPCFTFLFLLLGIAAGFRNLYLLVKRYFRDGQPTVSCKKNEPRRKSPPS